MPSITPGEPSTSNVQIMPLTPTVPPSCGLAERSKPCTYVFELLGVYAEIAWFGARRIDRALTVRFGACLLPFDVCDFFFAFLKRRTRQPRTGPWRRKRQRTNVNVTFRLAFTAVVGFHRGAQRYRERNRRVLFAAFAEREEDRPRLSRTRRRLASILPSAPFSPLHAYDSLAPTVNCEPPSGQ